MTDRNPNSFGRRAFLSRLMTTTSLLAVSSGWALAQSHHGGHSSPHARTQARTPSTVTAGPAFANPPAITGSNGNYAINVGMLQTVLGGQTINVRAYTDANNPPPPNAPLVAPTITLAGNGQPVQNVTVALTNSLPAEPNPQPTGAVTNPAVNDTPHGYNTVNLHTHGLHVDPLQDNVYIELQPALNGPGQACTPTRANPVWVCNGQYTYSYAFGQTPGGGTTRLPAGTYWYHPHKHGSVGVQVASGMAGALIVRGDLDAVPGVAGLTEQVMVVQLIEYTLPAVPNTGVAIVDPNVFYNGGAATNANLSVNGQLNPTVTMQYGEIQRWRIVNATSEQFFYLNVAAIGASPAIGPRLLAIAVDGVPLTHAPDTGGLVVPYALGTPAYQFPAGIEPSILRAAAVMNEIAVLAPAQRLDLLVQAPSTGPAGSSYAIQAVPWQGSSIAQQPILTVAMSGIKSPADALPASSAFNAGALFRPPLAAPSVWPQTPTQNIQFGFIEGNTGAIVNNSTSPTPFGIAATTNPPRPAVPPPPPPAGAAAFALPLPPPTPPAPVPAQLNLKLNAVDLWQVGSNPAPTIGFGPHAFHVHINSFMMTQRNGVDITAAAIWRDTVRIDQPAPPTTGVGAGALMPITPVQFVSQQLDYVGDFVLHCHVLQHEDAGMMWSVNIS